ncbi:hypothetical protein HZB93_04815 [Candidatus Falkowbacteria bacterium]|nr:hypothetical protein [Candidatus Falkowbacteria bacterium]
MKNKVLLVVITVIIMAGLGVAGYYYAMTQNFFQPTAWDGYYKMAGTLTCQGDFPGLTTIPMDGSNTTVSSNKIIDDSSGKSFDIDKSGKATEILKETQNETSSDVKADYQFYQEEGVKKFSANGVVKMDTTRGKENYSSTCSGTITGVKQ